ncbi:MAG: LegC family aminotransferase [Nitrospiraceae bacterium]|nr:MAG: LegC family aminotransferase [Nitrospiraceae bacterium]
MSREIHLDAPNIGELEKQYLSRAVDSGYVSTIGDAVTEFEDKCAEYLNAQKAVSTNSGTSAIHIALHELGIGEGDEVIVPALTFIATGNPVMYAGATPVLADVDIRTWNIEPASVEKAVTEKTKAIIPVHLYGNPCNMDEINKIAKKYNLYVVEDAAESLGALYGGRFTGALGDLGCFSFNGNKTITTGGGGMVVGNDVQRMEHIKYLINQARDKKEEIYHSEIGFNYRLTNIQAALGLAQFEKLAGFLEKKRLFNGVYKEELKDLNTIRFQEQYDGAESSFWFTCILSEDGAARKELQKRLEQKGIPTRRIFTPINEFPPYRDCKFIDNGNAHNIYERGVCLPGSTRNGLDDIKYVCSTLKEFYYEGCSAD